MDNTRTYRIGNVSVGSGIRSDVEWWHWDDEEFNHETEFDSFTLACTIFGEIQGEGLASWLRVWDECDTCFDLVQGHGRRSDIRTERGWL